MKKGMILSIVGLIGLIGTFILWGLTPKEEYIWDGGFYVILCIVFPIIALFGLTNIITNYYTKERYDSLINKHKKTYDPSKSIYVSISDLIYYLNIHYLGGDTLVIKSEESFYILERQVFSDQSKKKFTSIYNLNHNYCGNNFDKVLTATEINGIALIEFEEVEVVLMNNKYPSKLAVKRLYDNVKPHPNLMMWSIILLIFGVMFTLLSIGQKDWYSFIICGGIMLIIGIILLLVLIDKIKKESVINHID